MDASAITLLAKATLDGSMPFPEIVGSLISNDVEYYHVDFVACSMSFYGTSGGVVVAPLLLRDLGPVAESLDGSELRAAIADSQKHGQPFAVFCARAAQAGVQGYFAFLRGKRVTYLGRQGDHHVEWFPGAQPSAVQQSLERSRDR
jgi:uncharacterized protein YbcV (DUF1398 family)